MSMIRTGGRLHVPKVIPHMLYRYIRLHLTWSKRHHLCYLCLVFAIPSRLFIAALWSPAEKGLTSWLLFAMIFFRYLPMWYPGSGMVLDCIVS